MSFNLPLFRKYAWPQWRWLAVLLVLWGLLATAGDRVLFAAEADQSPAATIPTNQPFCLATNAARASWSPDGRQLVFCRSSARLIEIYDFNTRTNRVLAEESRDPAWSPDGKWIAYVRQPASAVVYVEEVMIMPPEGGRSRFVYPGNFMNWSGDSKTLFVNARQEQTLVACQIDAREAEAKILLEKNPYNYAMVSPDGTLIAVPAKGEMQVLDARTREKTYAIPMEGQPGGFAGWSPNGEWLVIGGVDQSGLGAWLVDLKNKKTLPLAGGTFTMPAWSPKGDWLAMDLRERTRREIWVFPRAWIDARLKGQVPVFELP